MTNHEIIAMQRRQRQLHESATTIATRLRSWAANNAGTKDLLYEAADVVEHLQQAIARQRSDAAEEERDARRAVSEAYAEGRHEGGREDHYF